MISQPYWTRHDNGKPCSQLALNLVSAVMLLGLVSMVANSAFAHEIRPAIVNMQAQGTTLTVRLETNVEAWMAEIGEEHENTQDAPESQQYNLLRALPSDDFVRAFLPRVDAFANDIIVNVDGERVPLTYQTLDVPNQPDLDLARDSTVILTGQLPKGYRSVTYTSAEGLRLRETILRVADSSGAITYTEFLTGANVSQPFALADQPPQSGWSVFVNYIAVGFDHIVPKGLDHIVFVIGLFLFSPRIGPLLAQVTAFTLAHTITLALGSLGVLNLTPWVVESIIALSIVYVGVENIFFRDFQRHRIVLVFIFGLLHGLGFAGVLGEFGLPEAAFIPALIGFNLGVEFGQLAVIAVCLALTFAIRNQRWYRSVVTVPASIVIALIGAYWVLERTGILPESFGGLI